MAARTFARDFCRAGLCVVSGLAFGIDAAAARGALDVGGVTIAVIGSGVDDASIYPRANFGLAQEILKANGLIISENPAGTKPQNWDFPKRNRIIAALGRATTVIDASVKSGALITAKYALELGREVYAVPGDALRDNTRGSNELLSAGAVPLMEAKTLLEAVFPAFASGQKFDPNAFAPHNQEEAAVIRLLSDGPKHIDELAEKSDLPDSRLQTALSALELRGAVIALGAMRYGLVP